MPGGRTRMSTSSLMTKTVPNFDINDNTILTINRAASFSFIVNIAT